MFDPLTISQTELTLACQQTDDTLIGHIGRIEVKSGVVLVGISLWKGWMNSTGHVRQYSKLVCTTIHKEEEERKLPDDNAGWFLCGSSRLREARTSIHRTLPMQRTCPLRM